MRCYQKIFLSCLANIARVTRLLPHLTEANTHSFILLKPLQSHLTNCTFICVSLHIHKINSSSLTHTQTLSVTVGQSNYFQHCNKVSSHDHQRRKRFYFSAFTFYCILSLHFTSLKHLCEEKGLLCKCIGLDFIEGMYIIS